MERALGAVSGAGPALRGRREVGWPGDTREAQPLSLEAAQRAHIEKVLRATGGRIEGPGGAARNLSLHPSTLRSRMRRLGIDWRALRGRPAAR